MRGAEEGENSIKFSPTGAGLVIVIGAVIIHETPKINC